MTKYAIDEYNRGFKEGYKQAIIDGKTQYQRPQGEWHHSGECSVCHKRSYRTTPLGDIIGLDLTDFCKNCGAKMKGGAE